MYVLWVLHVREWIGQNASRLIYPAEKGLAKEIQINGLLVPVYCADSQFREVGSREMINVSDTLKDFDCH